MDLSEFKKLLMESLQDDSVKMTFLKLFSDDGVSEEIAKYEKRISELEEQIASAADEKTEISLQLNKAKLDLAERDRKVSELEKTMSSSDSDLKTAVDKIASLDRQIEELNQKIEKSAADIAERDERISSMMAAQSAGDSSAKMSAEKIEALTAKVDTLNAELEKAKADIADRDKRITEITAERAEGDSSAKAASEQINVLNEKVKEADGQIAKYREDIMKLEGDVSELNTAINAVKAEKASADEKLSQQAAELESRAETINSLKEKNSVLEEEKLAVKAAADEANSKSTASAARIKELADQLEKARVDISSRDTKISELNTQSANDTKTMESLRSMNDNLTATMKELSEGISERDEKIDVMRKQLHAMLVLKEKINEYAETANAYAEEVENARQIVAERDVAIDSLNGDIARLNEAVETKTQQLTEREAYLTKVEEQMEALRTEAGDAKAEVSRMQEQVEAAARSVEGYKDAFGDLTKMFDKYNNLSPKTKAGLDENQVFPEGLTVRSFLSCGAQWGHIQALWEYTEMRINAEDFTDVASLNALFEYFIDFYNSSHKTPQYEVIRASAGVQFNDELHSRIMTREERREAFFNEGKKKAVPTGPIQEGVLSGYKKIKTDQVVQKAIVRI